MAKRYDVSRVLNPITLAIRQGRDLVGYSLPRHPEGRLFFVRKRHSELVEESLTASFGEVIPTPPPRPEAGNVAHSMTLASMQRPCIRPQEPVRLVNGGVVGRAPLDRRPPSGNDRSCRRFAVVPITGIFAAIRAAAHSRAPLAPTTTTEKALDQTAPRGALECLKCDILCNREEVKNKVTPIMKGYAP